jgi:hypothetical protein
MTLKAPLLLCGILLLLLTASPAAASQLLTSVSCSPTPPFLAGDSQHMVAQYMIIPSGSATFPPGHDLQMQTNLTDARWTIQVIVDGNNAARQTVSGSTAFVNGVILSYSMNHDVSFMVTIDGSVPETVSGSVTLLRIVELDNAGTPLPGSQSLISRPVVGNASAPVTIVPVVPLPTSSLATPAAAAARSPGFALLSVIAAVSLVGIVWMRRRS